MAELNSIFDYSSAFSYATIKDNESRERYKYNSYGDSDPYPSQVQPESRLSQWARSAITGFLYGSLAVGFPILGWFCIRRIHPLERCLIFRLGQRLPLKGPGLVVTFPGVDQIHVLDTRRQPIGLLDEGQEQLITSDRSIVRVNCAYDIVGATLNLIDPIKSCTRIENAPASCEQFVKLTFLNTISAAHVEDLEERLHLVMRKFVDGVNERLTDWGWELMVPNLPQVSVIQRSDPMNPVMDVIQAVAGGQATGQGAPSDNPLIALGTQLLSGLMPQANSTSPNTQETSFFTQSTEPEDPKTIDLCPLIGEMLAGYSFLITGDLNVSVHLEADASHDEAMYFSYSKASGSVVQMASAPATPVQARIKCLNMAVLVEAIKQRDSSKVTIEYS